MKNNYIKDYQRLVQKRFRKYGAHEGAKKSVGDEFSGMGKIQYLLLAQSGFLETDSILEIGCGSGRLAVNLAENYTGDYRGFDVIPQLVKHAQKNVKKESFNFSVSDGKSIPFASESADSICAFSVFTHLMPEHCYLYLKEVMRILKPGGQCIVSFLDIELPLHWEIFELSTSDLFKKTPLNMFLSKGHFKTWLNKLGFELVALVDGDNPVIGLNESIKLDSGEIQNGPFSLGQSFCHFMKPSANDS